MSWNLGDIVLPSPQGYEREPIVVATDVQTLDGSTKRDTVRKKYRHILKFEKLTQPEATDILSEYDLNTARSFSVSETNLTISAVNVLIDISTREYNTPGGDFREDFELILTEV